MHLLTGNIPRGYCSVGAEKLQRRMCSSNRFQTQERLTKGVITLVRRNVPYYFVGVQTALEVTVLRVKCIKE